MTNSTGRQHHDPGAHNVTPVTQEPGSGGVSNGEKLGGPIVSQPPDPEPFIGEPMTPAAKFAASLLARGVTMQVRNNRLTFKPASAYRNLSDEERAVLRHHRPAIKAQVMAGLPLTAPSPTSSAPEPVVWTADYSRRITQADVATCGGPAGLTRQQAYERAREILAEKERKQRAVDATQALRAFYMNTEGY
jgi:hypothetical protein